MCSVLICAWRMMPMPRPGPAVGAQHRVSRSGPRVTVGDVGEPVSVVEHQRPERLGRVDAWRWSRTTRLWFAAVELPGRARRRRRWRARRPRRRGSGRGSPARSGRRRRGRCGRGRRRPARRRPRRGDQPVGDRVRRRGRSAARSTSSSRSPPMRITGSELASALTIRGWSASSGSWFRMRPMGRGRRRRRH